MSTEIPPFATLKECRAFTDEHIEEFLADSVFAEKIEIEAERLQEKERKDKEEADQRRMEDERVKSNAEAVRRVRDAITIARMIVGSDDTARVAKLILRSTSGSLKSEVDVIQAECMQPRAPSGR